MNKMSSNPFDLALDEMPDIIPVFPLEGVLLLPRGHLPLNIFEPRYLSMVEDCMKANRMIGIVQPSHDASCVSPLSKIGCAGRIVQFQETDDGRFLITLKGVARFKIENELELKRGYRQVNVDWSAFHEDFDVVDDLGLDRDKLVSMLKTYFDHHEMSLDWNLITSVNDEKLLTCLAMICPFTPYEQQALLEAPTCRARASLFMNLLEMTIRSESASKH